LIHQDSMGRRVAPTQELKVHQKPPAASFNERFGF
jgi:hypothetical protein